MDATNKTPKKWAPGEYGQNGDQRRDNSRHNGDWRRDNGGDNRRHNRSEADS